jgi:hypothetical protein
MLIFRYLIAVGNPVFEHNLVLFHKGSKGGVRFWYTQDLHCSFFRHAGCNFFRRSFATLLVKDKRRGRAYSVLMPKIGWDQIF